MGRPRFLPPRPAEWDNNVQSPVRQYVRIAVTTHRHKSDQFIVFFAPKHIQSFIGRIGLNDYTPLQVKGYDMRRCRDDEARLPLEDLKMFQYGLGLAHFIADTVGYEISTG